MLLKTFKSNRAVNFILFPLMGVLFWLKGFIVPVPYPFYHGETENLLYSPIHNLLNGNLYIKNLITLSLLISLALIMLQISNRYNFIRVRTMLPASLFILIVSGFTGLHTMHPVYFGAFFVLLAIYRLFSAFDQSRPYSASFDTGFFLGIGSLFYFNLIILFPAYLVGVGILSRETKWREYVIHFIGFLIPFIFAFSYAYIAGEITTFLNTFELNILTRNNHIQTNFPLLIYSGFLLLLVFLGSIKMIQQYDTKKVSSRKFFTVFFLLFLFSILSFALFPATSQEMLVIAAIPVTFLTANFLVFIRSRFWGEFWFSLLFILVVVLQFIKT
jgi:hypothetical protein